MARYILLEVDDNEAAGDLVAALQRGPGNVFLYKKPDDSGEFRVAEFAAKVRALFAKPTKFCDCVKADDNSVKGAKLGWWVHRKCGKPKHGVCQHPRNLLLPEGPTDPKNRDLYLGIWEPQREDVQK
jgi:hypothetical protein